MKIKDPIKLILQVSGCIAGAIILVSILFNTVFATIVMYHWLFFATMLVGGGIGLVVMTQVIKLINKQHKQQ